MLATFNEPVVGFGVEGVSVAGGYISAFQILSGAAYTFLVYPLTSAGILLIGVNSGLSVHFTCFASAQCVLLV